jgi:putative nucleic acid modification protein with dual OB domain
MAYRKTMVCLANSRKLQGRCIAGREYVRGELGDWIRPVSDRPTEEISERERLYEGDMEPAVLDIIAIDMVVPRPHVHQQENHVIDRRRRWRRVGRLLESRLDGAVDHTGGPLWLNEFRSDRGLNDRVPEDALDQFRHSLVLVHPEHLTLSRRLDSVRAEFSLDGCDYRLRVTDPRVESWMATADGVQGLEDAYICVSLSEPFRSSPDEPRYAYKLVAAVITSRRRQRS